MDTNNTRLGTYCGLPLVDREPYCLFEACMDMDEKKWFNHQLHQLPNWKFVGRASSTPTSALVVIATAPSIGYDKVAAPMSWWEMAAVTKSNKQIYLLYLYISLSHAWIKKKYLSIYLSIHPSAYRSINVLMNPKININISVCCCKNACMCVCARVARTKNKICPKTTGGVMTRKWNSTRFRPKFLFSMDKQVECSETPNSAAFQMWRSHDLIRAEPRANQLSSSRARC